MPTAITPNTYSILLSDKDFNFKENITAFVSKDVKWEWNKIGGCGRCVLNIKGNYLRYSINADDNIQIYVPDSGGGASRWYQGYVQTVTPSLNGGNSNIQIECEGYSRWFKRIQVTDSGAVKVYSNSSLSEIAEDIIDTYLVPKSDITKGTIDGSPFSPDSLEFKTSVREALRTLYDLNAAVEYGVDADLQFFWRNQSDTITHKFWINNNIVVLADKIDFNGIINQVYFEGGKVSGAVLQTEGSSTSSQNKYGLHESILSNASIVSNGVASQYLASQLKLRGKPIRQLLVELKSIEKRFESSLPVGAISIIDPDASQTSAIYGTTGNGGSNKIYGTIQSGGSGQLYGGVRKDQYDRIVYTLNPEDGKIDAQIQFGNSLNFSRTSATIRRIQLALDTQRQREL